MKITPGDLCVWPDFGPIVGRDDALRQGDLFVELSEISHTHYSFGGRFTMQIITTRCLDTFVCAPSVTERMQVVCSEDR